MRPHGSSSVVFVLMPDGYGPLIELGVWCLSADSHFSTQSLAQSLLACPPFISHACCLRTRVSGQDFQDEILSGDVPPRRGSGALKK